MRAPHGCVSTLWTLSLVVVACDQVEVSAAGATTHLSDNEIDFAAYEAVQNDNIGRALEIFGELVARDGDDAFAAMWIGMLAIRRNNLQLAESAFSRAVSKIESRMWVGDANEGYALGAKRAGLELSLQRVRERLAAQEAKSAYATNQANSADGDAHAEFVKVASIRRVHHRELGQAEFEAQHAKAAIPVIVTGFESLADDDAPLWSDLEHLRAKCGHLVPRVVQHDPSSATWAGMHLASQPPATFAEYLDGLLAAPNDSGLGAVFDWGLRVEEGCRELLASFRVPSYFTSTIVAGCEARPRSNPPCSSCAVAAISRRLMPSHSTPPTAIATQPQHQSPTPVCVAPNRAFAVLPPWRSQTGPGSLFSPTAHAVACISTRELPISGNTCGRALSAGASSAHPTGRGSSAQRCGRGLSSATRAARASSGQLPRRPRSAKMVLARWCGATPPPPPHSSLPPQTIRTHREPESSTDGPRGHVVAARGPALGPTDRTEDSSVPPYATLASPRHSSPTALTTAHSPALLTARHSKFTRRSLVQVQSLWNRTRNEPDRTRNELDRTRNGPGSD